MPNDFWTEERTQALKDLVVVGKYSYAQIGAMLSFQFEVPFSRNCICGKVNRLGINVQRDRTPKGPQQIRKPRVKRERVPVLRIVAAAGNTDTLKIIETSQPAQLPELRCVEIDPLYLTLLAVPDKGCRYPYGKGPNHLFCGHPSLPGFSYCGPHKALCFGPGSSGERAAHKISRRHLEGVA